MPFEFKKCAADDGTAIEGLYEIQPKVFGDERGYFFESYSERDFFAAGLSMTFVQDNQSFSTKGVLRGLHFQTRHPQGKLVRAVSGQVYDVAVDLRNGSASFGKHFGVVLDGTRQNQFYIPQGFAHGFYVLSETAVFAYKCTDFYDPEGEGGIPWNDPVLGISWERAAQQSGGSPAVPLVSKKDMEHPGFSFEKKYFSLSGIWQG
ncbi:MAG: dTDP-4-dehydrorhamnose 3,5-epimerase [Treponema sp.]|nr:dTDP-4-dehydrorhamnose 3,5-epimerase [Treponema sp.]